MSNKGKPTKLTTSPEVEHKIHLFVKQYVPNYIPTQKKAALAIKKIIMKHDEWSRALGGVVLSVLQNKAKKE